MSKPRQRTFDPLENIEMRNDHAQIEAQTIQEAEPAPEGNEPALETKKRRSVRKPLAIAVVILVIAVGAVYGYQYWQGLQNKIYTDDAQITAPVISIGPMQPGVLKDVFVRQGDRVTQGQQLFNVSGVITSAQAPGIVTSVQDTPGQIVSGANAIVQMYDPHQLRVAGHIQEDQGLKDIRVGQKVVFTADAFGSKQYAGTVESIAPLADQASAVFSISDKRQESLFSVTVAFNTDAYPELKNGMMAKMWIYK